MLKPRQVLDNLAEVLPKWGVDGFEWEDWKVEKIIHIENYKHGVNFWAEYNYKTNEGVICWDDNYWEDYVNREFMSNQLSGEMWLTCLINIYYQIVG